MDLLNNCCQAVGLVIAVAGFVLFARMMADLRRYH